MTTDKYNEEQIRISSKPSASILLSLSKGQNPYRVSLAITSLLITFRWEIKAGLEAELILSVTADEEQVAIRSLKSRNFIAQTDGMSKRAEIALVSEITRW